MRRGSRGRTGCQSFSGGAFRAFRQTHTHSPAGLRLRSSTQFSMPPAPPAKHQNRAILLVIHYATGIRAMDYPASPERILRALKGCRDSRKYGICLSVTKSLTKALEIPPAPLWKRGVSVVLLFIVSGCPVGHEILSRKVLTCCGRRKRLVAREDAKARSISRKLFIVSGCPQRDMRS